MSDNQREAAQVAVWDGATRLFHWLLVLLVAAAWATREWSIGPPVWHVWIGYAILVLIVWRVLWGFVGSSTSRFRSFIYAPGTVIRYGLDFIMRRPRHFLGHNPLGGLVVVALLGLVGVQAALGLFAYDDHDYFFGGPLSSRVSEELVASATSWHLRLFDLLVVVIGLHVLANVVYLVWKRENLVRAMITGRKQNAAFEDTREATLAGWGLAAFCLILAAVIVFGGIILAGGRL